MITKSISNSLIVVCLFATGLYVELASAKWYVNDSEGYYKPQEFYNDKFGDFPPKDIDSQIMNSTDETRPPQAEKKPAIQREVSTTSTYQPGPDTIGQNQQQLPYNNYGQQNYNQGYYNQPPFNNTGNSQRPDFGNPTNSNGFGFSGPWNNNGSNFNNPMNNNRSGFSGPWNNNGSNFSGPWNNNGSNFSMPWGNNGSGFNPWGNNSGRRR
ncbi:MAG: hypothetical protein RQ982_10955 [Gammaproteobacteria bacterium]|nr:hypothetical protein [Gammaproteobacteria bacterium]